MNTQHKISLWMAVLVNISIMFGVGIFINTVMLAKRAGGLGFVSYLIIGTLMMPLIASLAKLLTHYPTGGFYSYAADTLSPCVGFISSWSYFIGKLGSAALIIDVFTRLMKTIIPTLRPIPTLTIDLVIILLFTMLNMLNVKTNMSVIYAFVVLKLTPVIFAILSSLYLWKHWSLPTETLYWSGISSSIPLVLFALVGFEAACSISRTIENPKRNAPKAIFYSFGLVICITTLYQLLFFLPLGKTLMAQTNYLGAFPSLLALVFPGQEAVANSITTFLHICTAAAALGGGYGILFSNHWNLYALAEHNHTFFPKLLTKMNKHQVPIACVIVEALVCAGYLIFTHGHQLLLQQISVLGCSISYALSVVSLFALQHTHGSTIKEKLVTYLAFGSCLIFLVTCIKNLLIDGPMGLFVYIALIALGVIMFFLSKKQNTQPNSSLSAKL